MRITYGLAFAAAMATGVAIAKLPAPTPEQQEAAAAKKQVDEAKLEKEKAELERAQNRVAEYYKKTKGGAGPAQPSGKTEDTNVSRKAVEGPRSTGPRGGTAQSAEAHSTPAK